MTQLISPTKFTKTVGLLRSFFLEKGFEEVHTQNRLSILAACEDPFNVATYNYAGEVWPISKQAHDVARIRAFNKPHKGGGGGVLCPFPRGGGGGGGGGGARVQSYTGRHDIISMFEFEMPGT